MSTVHSEPSSVYQQCNVYSAQWTLLYLPTMCTVHSEPSIYQQCVQCTVHSELSSIYQHCVQCIVHSVPSSIYRHCAQCTVHSGPFSIFQHCTHQSPHTVQDTEWTNVQGWCLCFSWTEDFKGCVWIWVVKGSFGDKLIDWVLGWSAQICLPVHCSEVISQPTELPLVQMSSWIKVPGQFLKDNCFQTLGWINITSGVVEV